MRAPREIRRWVARLVRVYGKPNGVVRRSLFDNPWMERKLAKSFKQRSRQAYQHEDRP